MNQSRFFPPAFFPLAPSDCPCAEREHLRDAPCSGRRRRELCGSAKALAPQEGGCHAETVRGRPGGHLPGSSRLLLQQLPKKCGEVLVFCPRGKVFLMHFPIIRISSDFPHRPQMTRRGQAARQHGGDGAGGAAGAPGSRIRLRYLGSFPARRATQVVKAQVRAIPQPHLRARDLRSEQGKPRGSPAAARLGCMLWLGLFANSDVLETSRARRSPQVPRGPAGGCFLVTGKAGASRSRGSAPEGPGRHPASSACPWKSTRAPNHPAWRKTHKEGIKKKSSEVNLRREAQLPVPGGIFPIT